MTNDELAMTNEVRMRVHWSLKVRHWSFFDLVLSLRDVYWVSCVGSVFAIVRNTSVSCEPFDAWNVLPPVSLATASIRGLSAELPNVMVWTVMPFFAASRAHTIGS